MRWLARFNQRIGAVLDQAVPIDEDGALNPPVIPLATDTKAARVALHDANESELRSGGELYDVRDVARKAADNAQLICASRSRFRSGVLGGFTGIF